jgi:MarR family 2-MHQ and catechol resistance regulon transcriptional repressor
VGREKAPARLPQHGPVLHQSRFRPEKEGCPDRSWLDIKYLDLKIVVMKGATKSEPDPSGTHLWLVMMKAHRTLERLAIQSIESEGVGLSDFGVMEMLLHKGPQPVNEIGRRIGLTSGAITTAVDRLEACAMVARENDPGDRRARVVRLTKRGAAQAAALFAAHKKAMDSAAGGLSKTERRTLIALLKKLGTHAGEHAARPKEK